jgi:MFS family permease
MLDLLHQTYIAVFRRYPALLRMALVALLGEVLFASLTNYAFSFYVTDDLHQRARVLGILVSTFLIAEMLLKLPFGHLSDRHGRRWFITRGLALGAATPLAICLLPTGLLVATPVLIYLVLMPLRVLDGASGAALWPPLFAAVPDHVPPAERGVAMSVMNTAYSVGLALGPALVCLAMKVGGLSGHHEWVRKAPFAMAVGVALCGAAVARGLEEDEGGPGNGEVPFDSAQGKLRVAQDDSERIARDHQAGALPPGRVIAVIMLITLGNMLATSTLGPYLALYVRDVTGIDSSNVGFLLLLLFIPALLLGIPIGHLTDRWPKRRVVQAGLAVVALGLWGVPIAHSLWPMMVAGGTVMLGFLFALPSWLALISGLAPEGATGKTMGLMATAQGLGAFLGPLLGGFLWEVSIRAPFYMAAGFVTCSMVTALLFLPAADGGVPRRGGESSVAGL